MYIRATKTHTKGQDRESACALGADRRQDPVEVHETLVARVQDGGRAALGTG